MRILLIWLLYILNSEHSLLMRVHRLFLYSAVVFFLFNASIEAQENYILDLVTADEHTNFGDVHNLYEDSSGIIWMGIYGKGLAYYNGKDVVRYELENEDKFSSRNDIFISDSNFMYLLSLIHISSPRDKRQSRMPSSA